jgi:flagellar protein FlgJ
MLNVNHADVYTDFSGLANLKNEAKSKTPGAIKEVAKQFESIFLNRVLKTMREAKLSEGILDNSQSKFYQDMYDQQLSIHLSGDGGIGLAELIVKQLSPKEENEEQAGKLSIDDYLNRSVASSRPQKPLDKQTDSGNIADIDVQAPAPVSVGETLVVEKENQIEVTDKQLTATSQFISQLRPYVEKIRTEGNAVPIDDMEVVQSTDKPITTAKQFISQLQPYAEHAAKELGVDAKVLLAQSALETGWGKSVIKNRQGESSHNLFNIKANSSWKGAQTKVSTLEYDEGVVKKEMAGFRSYSSYAESFKDYVNFIKSNPRYGDALKAVSKPEHYMRELQQAGYATDPAYAGKVMRIYHSAAFSSMEPASILAMK